jgi:glutathione S-transferase
MALELFWVSGSPNAWRAKLAMDFKGVDYVSTRVDTSKQEHKSPEFLAMNPRGKVPVLKAGDQVIHESIAIMAYIDREYPTPPLFGSNAAETGLVWQRIFEFVNYTRDAIDGLARAVFTGQASSAPETVRAAAASTRQALAWMEEALKDANYLAGNTVSAADIAALPNVEMLARIGKREDVSTLELGFDDLPAAYPAIAAWLTRLRSIPGYEAAYPPHWRG